MTTSFTTRLLRGTLRRLRERARRRFGTPRAVNRLIEEAAIRSQIERTEVDITVRRGAVEYDLTAIVDLDLDAGGTTIQAVQASSPDGPPWSSPLTDDEATGIIEAAWEQWELRHRRAELES